MLKLKKVFRLANDPRTMATCIMFMTLNSVMISPFVTGWGIFNVICWLISLAGIPLFSRLYKEKTGTRFSHDAWKTLKQMIDTDAIIKFWMYASLIICVIVGGYKFIRL